METSVGARLVTAEAGNTVTETTIAAPNKSERSRRREATRAIEEEGDVLTNRSLGKQRRCACYGAFILEGLQFFGDLQRGKPCEKAIW